MIHFALAHNMPLAEREGARERVAERFGGIASTTRLVSAQPTYRLYAMDEAKK